MSVAQVHNFLGYAKASRNSFEAIPKKGESYTRRSSKDMKKVLDQTVRKTSALLRKGKEPKVAIEQGTKELEQDLFDVHEKWVIPVALDGYKMAGALLGRKTYLFYDAKKAISVDEEMFGADELTANNLRPRVGQWIKSTSKLETRTTSKLFNTIIKGALAGTEDGEGITAAQLASMFVDEGLATNIARGVLMARTTVIWSVNRGAVLQYKDSGFKAAAWLTTQDDATCEYCASMDGRKFALGKPIFKKGSVIAGSDGGTMELGVKVEHSPLHPHCRCTQIPIVI